jgi:class 3 adenylate cyclase/tetratricopeptide (TPR) repeat protein
VKVCPSCGRENADDARFCSGCATSLEAGAPPREERKVVTCLFCDLVGFTARAERMDPEEVRRLLQPYHSRVRSELERRGGTVEKFIGDAVMAVFGAPTAHEDDPERAVRAALAIRDALVEEGQLEVRIGVTTGEALIALGARPEVGEGMASGDVVNTAARLQVAAPIGSVLVDETTYHATERAIEYGETPPIEAKGKTELVPAWEALRTRARVGVERVGGAELIGRGHELTLLRETLTRVKREKSIQLVTLVGVPGIGKSRLVYELFATVEESPELVFWRRGRSLAYGEGVTFWALSEMVKAQAGILESDSSGQAGDKLREAVERYVSDPTEVSWVERHLRPLAGLEAEETSAGDRRGEAFAAWRRFLEALAEERPLVLVFEDLHWADDALLDFVDHLVDWASGVPILALCTARPELLVRRSAWGGGKVNSSTIRLSPLSEGETATLIHTLVGRSVLPADVQEELLARAGGNPLYAEEFTRMLRERPSEVSLPESVQGIIAARLDTLPPEEKELIQNAAVMGKTFWLGALGQDEEELSERLHSLELKEFVSRERRSSVAGEPEYAFRHALVREVAYEQIPRAQRVDKHRSAAEWIEALGRPDDHAEMLAHHYVAALEYALAAGLDAGPLPGRACARLGAAGDRAFALNAFPHAAGLYERALDLSPEDEAPSLLLRYGHALHLAADARRDEFLERAAEGLLRSGDREGAAEAYALLTVAAWEHGQRDRAFELVARAVELVREVAASSAKARVLAESSRLLVLGGQPREGLAIAQEGFAMADALGLTELAARTLNNVGLARSTLGDHRGGIADLERSCELALSVSSPEAARSYNNLAAIVLYAGDPVRAGELFEEALRVGERLGAGGLSRYTRGVLSWNRYYLGLWDEAMERADAFIAECEAGFPSYVEYEPRIARARIRLARGVREELVLEDIGRAIEIAREVKDPQATFPVLSYATFSYVELGRLEEAQTTAEELVPHLTGGSLDQAGHVWLALDFAWVAEALGHADAFRRVLAAGNPDDVWRQAARAVLDRDFERAAAIFAPMGYFDEAYARLRAANKLLAEGRRTEADAQLERALFLYRSVGATRYVRKGEALLAAAS